MSLTQKSGADPTVLGTRPDVTELRAYMREGAARAAALGNRGPIRFNADGSLHSDITDAYWANGFYIFENVLRVEELAEIEADVKDIMERLPTHRGAPVDARGRSGAGRRLFRANAVLVETLGDPMGGTKQAAGRHEIKMVEATAAADAPDEIVYLILGNLQFSDACLRTYGHPDLLRVAAAIHGPDFVPFSDALFIKEPGRGAAVSWHQDGTCTHWDNPDWDQGIHGFNLMGQLYGSTPENGVWVVPGSHKSGKIDIRAMVDAAGSERLPDAVPLVCGPGDVAITNRQALHASFPNTSPDWRVTVNMGFHRLSSVLGVRGGEVHNAPAVYDAARIKQRSRVIGYAIDARAKRFPDETPYEYEPFKGKCPIWDAAAKASMHDYNLLDLSI